MAKLKQMELVTGEAVRPFEGELKLLWDNKYSHTVKLSDATPNGVLMALMDLERMIDEDYRNQNI